jgi:hypothetical protein
MTPDEQFKLGQEIFKRGGSYKSCKNANTLKGYTYEERLSSCGYTYESWNRDGQGQFGTRQKTIRNNMDVEEGLAFREGDYLGKLLDKGFESINSIEEALTFVDNKIKSK